MSACMGPPGPNKRKLVKLQGSQNRMIGIWLLLMSFGKLHRHHAPTTKMFILKGNIKGVVHHIAGWVGGCEKLRVHCYSNSK